MTGGVTAAIELEGEVGAAADCGAIVDAEGAAGSESDGAPGVAEWGPAADGVYANASGGTPAVMGCGATVGGGVAVGAELEGVPSVADCGALAAARVSWAVTAR